MGRVVALLLLIGPPAWADRVVLKSGGILDGVVVAKDAERVLLEVGPGRVGIPLARIERIEAAPSAVATFRERAARLMRDDAAGWTQLGLWAREHGLGTQALVAFEAALAADPGYADAHRALGHVLHDQTWLSREESYRARGLVPFEGGWVTPEERQIALDERATAEALEQSRRDSEARAREAEARARAAELEARRLDAQEAQSQPGIPYGWVLAGGVTQAPRCLEHSQPGHSPVPAVIVPVTPIHSLRDTPPAAPRRAPAFRAALPSRESR